MAAWYGKSYTPSLSSCQVCSLRIKSQGYMALSLVPKLHFLHLPKNVSGELPIPFSFKCARMTGAMFFLTLDIIENCIPQSMPLVY